MTPVYAVTRTYPDMDRTLERSRADLSAFLRSRRERLAPEDVGLPGGGRRRTPGLRREEVAALAGVGVSWYTWLEQGRDIGVSPALIDTLCGVLRLDAQERRHLYLLTFQRPPAEVGETWCAVPPIIHGLLRDLPLRPAYVLNLRWDVLAWNPAADRLFAFSRLPPERRNVLWMLFMEPHLRTLLCPWEDQARQMLASFRRDYVHAQAESDVAQLVRALEEGSAEFRSEWQRHAIDGPCQGLRHFQVATLGPVTLEHTSLTIDADKHLRLVYYTPGAGEGAAMFEQWLQVQPGEVTP